MRSFLLDSSATVLCLHGGQASSVGPNPRVKVSGQLTIQHPIPWIVAGCQHHVSGVPIPCITAQWMSAAIVADIEAALEQFATPAEDLSR